MNQFACSRWLLISREGEGEAEEFVGTSLYVYRVDNNKSFPSWRMPPPLQSPPPNPLALTLFHLAISYLLFSVLSTFPLPISIPNSFALQQ